MLFESLSAVYQDTGLQWSSAHFSFVVEQLLKSAEENLPNQQRLRRSPPPELGLQMSFLDR